MASDEHVGKLSNEQICALADIISPEDMETIATGYMGLKDARIEEIKEENQGASIKTWANVNPNCQIQVSLNSRKHALDLNGSKEELDLDRVMYFFCKVYL